MIQQSCLFCGGDASAVDHLTSCNGRQGRQEAVYETRRRYDGSDYVPVRDDARLDRQYDRIYGLMRDGGWRTLSQIEVATGDPAASISAQLRHMRKPRFGGHVLNKRYLGEGLFEYQLVLNTERLRMAG